MRLDPETFETIRNIFFGIILLFFVFVGIQILSIQHRRRHPAPPPRRPPAPPGGGTGEYKPVTKGAATAATFGTSGIGAGDMAPAGFPPTSSDLSSSSDMASTSWDSGSDYGGGDSGGGGDYSGGGGDSGGGGSSGSWS